ncbi:MAG: hypothetical protein GTN65_01835 [Armatimonadetes bacterium]|nr:hypothetical protein [Armatimonadota bacterium]NIO95849.1 hypothetical protein [Armatimonadota bacterium]
MAIFLSAALIEEVVAALLDGGYSAETPAAVVYKASWQEEIVVRAPLKHLVGRVRKLGIRKQALILVGDFLGQQKGRRSRLYDGDFKHEFRQY